MRKFEVVVNTGYPRCILRGEFDVEDDATAEEIEELAADMRDELTSDWGYKEIK